MIALISIRLTSLVDKARVSFKAYTDRNDIRQQVIVDLYESHIALAETVKEMADLMVEQDGVQRETLDSLVKLTGQTHRIVDHLMPQGTVFVPPTPGRKTEGEKP